MESLTYNEKGANKEQNLEANGQSKIAGLEKFEARIRPVEVNLRLESEHV